MSPGFILSHFTGGRSSSSSKSKRGAGTVDGSGIREDLRPGTMKESRDGPRGVTEELDI